MSRQCNGNVNAAPAMNTANHVSSGINTVPYAGVVHARQCVCVCVCASRGDTRPPPRACLSELMDKYGEADEGRREQPPAGVSRVTRARRPATVHSLDVVAEPAEIERDQLAKVEANHLCGRGE